jgi:hypothetical protein
VGGSSGGGFGDKFQINDDNEYLKKLENKC